MYSTVSTLIIQFLRMRRFTRQNCKQVIYGKGFCKEVDKEI